MVNLRGRDVESWVREADAKVREHVQLPAGYTLEFGGQFENLREAEGEIAIVVPAALAFIFILIFMAFGSVRQALLVFSEACRSRLPAASSRYGCANAIQHLRRRRLHRTCSGVAVLNGVVMISISINCASADSIPVCRYRRIFNAPAAGFMTAAVAAFGFIPMALSTSAGAEVQRPLATVVIGGIISSTFLTLLLLPVLYDWVERRARANEISERPAIYGCY